MSRWKTDARGRHKATLTPELDIWVHRVSSNPQDTRYNVSLFGLMECIESGKLADDEAAKTYAERRAREILAKGLATLGEAQ